MPLESYGNLQEDKKLIFIYVPTIPLCPLVKYWYPLNPQCSAEQTAANYSHRERGVTGLV